MFIWINGSEIRRDMNSNKVEVNGSRRNYSPSNHVNVLSTNVNRSIYKNIMI